MLIQAYKNELKTYMIASMSQPSSACCSAKPTRNLRGKGFFVYPRQQSKLLAAKKK